MFLIAFVSVVGLMLLAVAFFSPQYAARVGWAFSFIIPSWLGLELSGSVIDSRTIAAGMAIAVVAIRPSRFQFPGFSWVDLIPILIFISCVLSTTYNERFSPTMTALLLGIWVLPYVLGRLIITSEESAEIFVPLAAKIACILAAILVIESITNVNLFNTLLGHAGSREGETGHRFGLKRAEGPFGQPIYAGMVVALSSPWVFTQAYQSIRGHASKLWILAPILVSAGVVSSLSRGPILVLLAIFFGLAWYYLPPLRLPALFLGACMIALAVVMVPDLMDVADTVESKENIREIQVAGETYTYSGTRHRYLLFIVYEDAIQEAGWLGFGKWGISPKHITYVEPHLRKVFYSIDNHYLLHYLSTGIFGTAAFLLLPLGVFLAFLLHSHKLSPSGLFLTVGLTSSVLGASVVLATVWFSDAFSFAFLMNTGCIISLLVYARGLEIVNIQHAHPQTASHFAPRKLPNTVANTL